MTAAGENGPFVLVGVSLGGPYITVYTGLYGEQVAGLVYVDASHPDQLKRFETVLPQTQDMKRAVQAAGKWVSWTGVPRLVASRARNGKSEAMARITPRAREIALAYFATSLGALVSERDAFPTTLEEAGVYRNLGARPVAVLTHGEPMPDMSSAEAEKFDKTWLEMQMDMATWSDHGTQRTIRDAGHYIPNDNPDAVIGAIRQVVNEVRSAR